MENVIKQLRQFRTDAIYEKKKHYNAADRKRGYYKLLSISQIVLNAITGTALLPVVFGKGSKTAEVIALVCTIAATIFASIQKIGDFENQSQGNSKAGDMYLRISKKINLVLNLIKDGVLSKQEIVNKAEEIQREIGEANEIGSQFPTSTADYKKAQIGVNSGEETYTQEELGLWE